MELASKGLTSGGHIKVLHLIKNMHVDPNDAQSAQFTQWFLDIGHGKDLPLDHTFALPEHMICVPETSNLIQQIYPDPEHGDAFQDKHFLEHAILCPQNVEVDDINSLVFHQFHGDGHVGCIQYMHLNPRFKPNILLTSISPLNLLSNVQNNSKIFSLIFGFFYGHLFLHYFFVFLLSTVQRFVYLLLPQALIPGQGSAYWHIGST